MKLNIKYLDNIIEISNNTIESIEIENKQYFYRLVNDLNSISNGEIVADISLLNNDNKEINVANKIKIFIDFFNINLNSKKNINDISNYIINNFTDVDKEKLKIQYHKTLKEYKKILNSIDLPLSIDFEESIENIIKSIKIKIENKNNLLDNLLTLIDLESILQTNNLLVFINLKQYLTKEELKELCKYSIYNGINIIFIDSKIYDILIKNEKKIIIDENLDEFMLQ